MTWYVSCSWYSTVTHTRTHTHTQRKQIALDWICKRRVCRFLVVPTQLEYEGIKCASFEEPARVVENFLSRSFLENETKFSMSEISEKMSYFCSRRRCRHDLEVDPKWIASDNETNETESEDVKGMITFTRPLSIEHGNGGLGGGDPDSEFLMLT